MYYINLGSDNIIWIKEVGTRDRWAYMDVEESETFNLHWPQTALANVAKPRIGDIILLKQHRRLTHLVVPFSDTIGQGNSEKWPYYREVICLKKLEQDKSPNINAVFPFSLSGGSHGIGYSINSFLKKYKDLIAFSDLQKQIWNAFYPNQHNTQISLPNTDETEPSEITRPEGEEFFDCYRRRKRSAELAKLVKQKAKSKYGKLICEACEFSFEDKYGTHGENYIEAHHRIPISSYEIETETSEKDIILLCSNCHRMIHSGSRMLTLEDLKNIIIR